MSLTSSHGMPAYKKNTVGRPVINVDKDSRITTVSAPSSLLSKLRESKINYTEAFVLGAEILLQKKGKAHICEAEGAV